LIRSRIALITMLILPGLSQTLNFQYYNSTKDFPSRRVWTIFQDHNGVMWFGDIEGLLRYDGITYTLYQERHGIPGTPILAICEQGAKLMIGTTNGLAAFQNGHADKISSIPTSPIRALLSRGSNALWIGSGKGLFLYQDGTARNIYPEKDIRSICYFNGKIYAGTRSGELISIQKTAHKELKVLHNIANLGSAIRSLHSHNGQLYVGASTGLFRLSEQGVLPVELIAGTKTGISKMISDGQGLLWLGTWGNSIINYNAESGEARVLGNQNGIPSPFVTGMILDQEKNLWVSFYNGGIIKYSDKSFLHYPIRGGSSITRLNIDSQDNIWFTSSKYGLMELEQGHTQPVSRGNAPVNEPTYGLFVDSKDNVWQIQPRKLYRFNGEKTDIFIPPMTGKTKGAYRWLFEDSQGRIWFGGTKGIARLDHGKLINKTPMGDPKKRFWHCLEQEDRSIVFSSINKLWKYKDDYYVEILFKPGDQFDIHSLLEVRKNTLLVGTSQGLFLQEEGKEAYAYPNTAEFNISILFKDSKSRIWAGSRNGIWQIQNKQAIDSYRPKRTMGSIENIIEDSSGTLWFIAHNRNILYDGHQWTERRFPGDLAIQSFNPIPTDKEGVTWFATNKGLTSYNPSEQLTNPQAPVIQTCYLEFKSGKRIAVHPGSSIELDSSQRNFVLHYQSHSFINEALNRYKLVVEGPDSDSRITKNSFKEFMNMTPGTYSISILPINGNNIEGKSPYGFTIRMGMPFWKKPWAIIVFLLLLTFIISVISKIMNHRKLMRLQARNDWLEHELKIKTESLLEAKKRETTSALTVTLSDKISQPLMRIQGNIDLINQKKSISGNVFRTKVSEIQQSIHRINRVMKRLRELESVQFDEYTPGISMISLDDKPRKIDADQGGILFVDDEDTLLDVWNTYFSTLGYRVFLGHSVEEAMDMLNESSDQIQVIVSDNKMPGKTGYDFLIEMQEKGYNHPFFILTGFDAEPQLKEMLSKGLRGIIQKPIMLADLHNILKPFLKNEATL